MIDLPADSSGKRRQKTTSHDSKKEAQAWLARTVQELRAGEVYDTTLTVGEYLTGWLAGKQSLRPSTVQAYRAHLDLHLLPALGHLRLLDLRSHHVEQLYRSITAGNGRRERPVGPGTMRKIHATLTSALNTAVRRGLIRRNPAATVELPKHSRVRSKAWTAEEVTTFLTAISDDHLYVLYRLLVVSGLRRGEAVGLRWSDVDLTNGVITVNQQVVNVAGDLVVGPPKTEAGARTVALDQDTVVLLARMHRLARIQHGPANSRNLEGCLVFTHADGRELHPTYVSRHFTTLIVRHGLPGIRLHDLRHTSASIGLASGESLLEVSRRLGHSSIGITADTYSHVSPAAAKESVQRLAGLINTVG